MEKKYKYKYKRDWTTSSYPQVIKLLANGGFPEDAVKSAAYMGLNMALPGLGTAFSAGSQLASSIAPEDEYGVTGKSDLVNTAAGILDPIGNFTDAITEDGLNLGERLLVASPFGGAFLEKKRIKDREEEIRKNLPNPEKLGEMANGGKLNQYNTGGTHESNPNGGIPLNGFNASVEEGETSFQDYVFSDRLKIDKTLAKEFNLPKKYIGKTFADASKGIEKQSPREFDSIDIDTKKRMLGRLRDSQEAFKAYNLERDINALVMKYGGEMGKQMAVGGPLSKEEWILQSGLSEDLDDIDTLYDNYVNSFWENQKIKSKDIPSFPFKLKPSLAPRSGQNIIAGPYKDGYVFLGDSPEELAKKYTLGNPSGSSDVVGGPIEYTINQSPYLEAARYAPMIANFISGLNSDKLNREDYEVTGRVQAPVMNIDPILDANNRAYNRMLESIRGGSGGNAGAYLATLGQAQVNKGRMDADAIYNKENMDAQNEFAAQQANLELDRFNVESRYRTDDWNARSREAAKNLQRKAAENLGQIADSKISNDLQWEYLNMLSDNYKVNRRYNWKRKGGYFWSK